MKPTQTELEKAVERIEKFLLERNKILGIDKTLIAGLNTGDDHREAELTPMDIRTVLAALEAAQTALDIVTEEHNAQAIAAESYGSLMAENAILQARLQAAQKDSERLEHALKSAKPIYANRKNTTSVRSRHELGGYVKHYEIAPHIMHAAISAQSDLTSPKDSI